MRTDLPHRYEGPEVLTTLLGTAGCALSVEDVRAEFDAALEEDMDTEAGEVIPLLFEREPRFRDAEDARRLYANLLGLWDQVRDRRLGRLPTVRPEPPALPPVPEGAVDGDEVPPAYAAWAWRTITEGDARAQRRWEDRLENRQGVLVDWVRERMSEGNPEAEEIALGLCVLVHAAFVRAFGARRVPPVTWRELAAAAALDERPQTALTTLCEDSLDEAVEAPEAPLDEADRARISAALSAVRLALTRAVR